MDANEISQISILKDAASAVYGIRAANGVVLLQQKRAFGTLEFTLFQLWYYKCYKPSEGVTAYEYALMRNEGIRNEQRL